MTFENINVEQAIESVQEQMKADKSLSPALANSINLLILLIKILISRLGLNSSNSSLPPSTNNPRKLRGKDKKKRKKKSVKNVGGQNGHEGTTLEQFEDPDEVIPLSAEVLLGSDEHRYVADFPAHITKSIQYGPSVKSLAVYMSQYQLVPYNRVQEVFKDQFGLDISQGSISNFNREAYEKLEGFENEAIKSLESSKVLNADETGIKIDGTLAWLHVLGNSKTTVYFAHEKRGKEAIDAMGIIPNYKGILCHDHWKPYLGYDCTHALCNAHHLRELQWVIDFKGHKWAKSMKTFLSKLQDLVDEYGGKLPDELQNKKIRRYRDIIKAGQLECPIYMPVKGRVQRGKVKQTKERNLLDRLDKFEDQVLLFMKNKDVPFTNNQAERDIRMVKVHQKISGQFKSMNGAKYFCRIRGFLMTLRKRGHAPLDKLQAIFDPEHAE